MFIGYEGEPDVRKEKGKSGGKSIHLTDPKTGELRGRVSTQGKDDAPTASVVPTAPKPVMSRQAPGPAYAALSNRLSQEKYRLAQEESKKIRDAELAAKWLPLKPEDLQSVRQNAYDVTSEISNKFLEIDHQPKFNWEDPDFIRYKTALQDSFDYLDLVVREHQGNGDAAWIDLPTEEKSIQERCYAAEQAFRSAYFNNKGLRLAVESKELRAAYIEAMRLPFFKSSNLKAKLSDLDDYISMSDGLNRSSDQEIKRILKEAKSDGLRLEEDRLKNPKYREAKQVLEERWLARSLLWELDEYGRSVDYLERETFSGFDEDEEEESDQSYRLRMSKKNLTWTCRKVFKTINSL